MNIPITLSDNERLATALAILGPCSITDLAVVSGYSRSQIQALLETDERIIFDASHLSFSDATKVIILKAAEERDFLHFLQLHKASLDCLSTKLQKGQSIDGEKFQAIFNRYAEQLINQSPEQLLSLVSQISSLPLDEGLTNDCQLYKGIAKRNLGRYSEAISLFTALIGHKSLEADTKGRALNARAISHFLLGQFQLALDDYEASLEIWQQLDNIVQQGMVRLNIGVVAYECQSYTSAEENLQLAIELLDRTKSFTWLASAYFELGLVYRDQGMWTQALDCFDRCIERRKLENAQNQIAIAISSIGDVQMLCGQFDKSRESLLAALAGMESETYKIDLLLRLGLLAQTTDDHERAKSYYEQAYQLTQKIHSAYTYPIVHYRMGTLFAESGQADIACDHWETAINWIENNRTNLAEEGLKIGLLGKWQQIYESLILLHIQNDNAADALHYAERSRARAFLDMLDSSNNSLSMGSTNAVSTHYIQQYLDDSEVIVEFYLTGRPDSYQMMISRMPTEAEALRHLLLAPEKLLAFVISAENVTCIQLDLMGSTIASQHFNRSDGRLRGVRPTPGRRMRVLNRWSQLGGRLFGSLTPHLQSHTHIYFVPHHVLHYFPLHTLLELSGLRETASMTTSYAPSASILINTKHSQQRASRFAALTIGVDADDLTQAEAEAIWISQQFDGDNLLGNEATLTAVCAALPNYDVIHFSCHGHFRQRAPMESALQLVDGELTAAMLLDSVKLKADLVVLSACDTGLNDLHPGDELMGLTRAFLGCGARSLLATLWPVHEIPTRLFMEHFYETWFNGATKSAAVLAAQQFVRECVIDELGDMLRQYGLDTSATKETISLFRAMLPGDRPFDHPYYWGGFILMGASD